MLHPTGLGADRGMADYLVHQLGHADIFVMMNESRVFRRGASAIQFVGVEDYWTPRYDPRSAFEFVRADLPTITLCHNPDAACEISGLGAHWVLAGHTHGSQLVRSRLGSVLLRPSHSHFAAGQYALNSGAQLYVNRGLGYARRVNVNFRPEITLFTLRGGKS
jgi:predicted MPP superfamily phosphohydrolase